MIIPALSASAGKTKDGSRLSIPDKLLPQKVQRIRVLGKYNDLFVAIALQLLYDQHQGLHFCIYRQTPGAFQQLFDCLSFFKSEGFFLQFFRLIAIQDVIFHIVIRDVFKRQLRNRLPLFQHIQAFLQCLFKRIKTAGQATPVDGHDKADGCALILGGIVVG